MGLSGIRVLRLDRESESVVWTTSLSFRSGNPNVVRALIATDDSIYLAADNEDQTTGIHIWRLDSASGVVVASRTLSIPTSGGIDPQLALGPFGLYVAIYDTTGDLHARVTRLNRDDLSEGAHFDIKALDLISSGPSGVWTLNIVCGVYQLLVLRDPVTLTTIGVSRTPIIVNGLDTSTTTTWTVVTRGSPYGPNQFEAWSPVLLPASVAVPGSS
jgi:hypothetical protein